MYNSEWYNSLTKPFLAPPDWIFQPMWLMLYTTILVSFLIYLFTKDYDKIRGYTYFAIQLILNFLWSTVFFGMKNISLALIVILLIIVFTILTIKEFYSVSKAAGVILIPYLIWIIFAAYLNGGYLLLN